MEVVVGIDKAAALTFRSIHALSGSVMEINGRLFRDVAQKSNVRIRGFRR